jgi:hypothetical protein
MKSISIEVFALLYSSVYAVKVSSNSVDPIMPPNLVTSPLLPQENHWNEDYHSGPNPLAGVGYVTSTQARLSSEGSDVEVTSHLPIGLNPDYPLAQYNKDALEYKDNSIRRPYTQFIGLKSEIRTSDTDSDDSDDDSDSGEDDEAEGSTSSDDDDDESESGEDEDDTKVQLNQKWMVGPDYGEVDPTVVLRESDTGNGVKFSGWTNPLGWTDDGTDDDLVAVQLAAAIRFDESEGPTKVDLGDLDQVVVPRESDIGNGLKYHGWTNPLSWADEGADDETVL